MPPMSFPKMSERVYELLLKQIVNRRYEPGQRLIEEQLGRELGVSRTPLRDAMNALAKDGFIRLEPRKGASVREFTLEDLVELYDIRMVLEGLAARLAANHIEPAQLDRLAKGFEQTEARSLLKADTALHRTIIDRCGNAKLQELLVNLKNLVQVFRTMGYSSRERSESATLYHRRIIEALKRRDGQEAELLMREHIEKSKNDIVAEANAGQEND
jgi:DNA-binding GntR family transcriptional regulator